MRHVVAIHGLHGQGVDVPEAWHSFLAHQGSFQALNSQDSSPSDSLSMPLTWVFHLLVNNPMPHRKGFRKKKQLLVLAPEKGAVRQIQ